MKTVTNPTKATRTITRDWDDESGEYSYYWVRPDGTQKYATMKCACGKQFYPTSYYGRNRKCECGGALVKKFVVTEIFNLCDKWTAELQPGETLEVPTHKETYAQSASRTGQFKSHLQYRKTS